MIGKALIQDQGKDDLNIFTVNSGVVELPSALASVPGEARPAEGLPAVHLPQPIL